MLLNAIDALTVLWILTALVGLSLSIRNLRAARRDHAYASAEQRPLYRKVAERNLQKEALLSFTFLLGSVVGVGALVAPLSDTPVTRTISASLLIMLIALVALAGIERSVRVEINEALDERRRLLEEASEGG